MGPGAVHVPVHAARHRLGGGCRGGGTFVSESKTNVTASSAEEASAEQETAAEEETEEAPAEETTVGSAAEAATVTAAASDGIALASEEDADGTAVASGTCGDDLTWTLDEDGVLTISGTGDMTDYIYYSAPWYSYRTSITQVVIESGVTSIGSYAFSGCTGLTSVVIGSGVTRISEGMFSGCTSLTSVIIPDSVTSIGSLAFSGCTGLTDITIGTGVTSINNLSFYNTAFYTDESNWEDGVLYLGTYLIDADDIALEENYTIKNGTTVIAESAFDWCYDLTSVTIPESVTVIGERAFYVCYRLTDVYYSGSESDWAAISIGSNNESLTSATIHYSGSDLDEEDTHTHSYTATVTKAATCTTAGVRTYTCSCGDSYTETIPATGHTWNDGEVTTPATRYTEGEKTYTCTVCGATKTETIAVLTGSAAEFLFTDVTNTAASYYTPVYWAYDYGITKGTSATAFSPSATCTRAQFVTFLWRLAGEPEPASSANPFTDVTNTSASYYKAVLWAVEQGVTKGTSATTFSPSQTITRAQAVTFLYRYAGEPAVSASSSFTDVTNTSASYYKAVIWAVEKGITNGTTSTTFSPSNPCTRGQMVTFLYRFAVEPLS